MSDGAAWRWTRTTIILLLYFVLTTTSDHVPNKLVAGICDGVAYWCAVWSYLGYRRAWTLRGGA